MGECAAILAAELIYGNLICAGERLGPGWRAVLTWTPSDASGASWNIEAEVVPNAVWRRGRLFIRCPDCQRRATRLYVPLRGLAPRCRHCWGLNYGSQSWCYRPSGVFAWLGPLAYVTTIEKRRLRREAARARYDARRSFL